eukprot:1153850-Pelagomonas_calceolata.AAC.2
MATTQQDCNCCGACEGSWYNWLYCGRPHGLGCKGTRYGEGPIREEEGKGSRGRAGWPSGWESRSPPPIFITLIASLVHGCGSMANSPVICAVSLTVFMTHVRKHAGMQAVVKQEQEEPGAPFCRGLSACMGPAVAHAESAPPDSARSQKRGPRNQPAQPAKPAGLTTSGPAPDRLSRNFLAPSCVWLLGRVDECYSLMSWIEAAWEVQRRKRGRRIVEGF